jgi:endonuclease YncB( thermonuclease family)
VYREDGTPLSPPASATVDVPSVSSLAPIPLSREPERDSLPDDDRELALENPIIEGEEDPSLPEPEPIESWYPVIKVVDGDTFAVMIEGRSETVRLIGVDTPETVHPQQQVECFGREASEVAKRALDGGHIRLEYDPSQGTRDKYGRLLAYAYLLDGTFFNLFLIEQGYAHEYTYAIPYRYQTIFKDAQKRAREGAKGLWNEDACAASVPATPAPAHPQGSYACSHNTYNCNSFMTHQEAQAAFEYCGGADNDVHYLDVDGDGQACETLP